MTNLQTRLIASALGMLAGAILCSTERVDVNVGLTLLILSATLFAVNYYRSQKA
jgi:hypothetical protein